MASVTLRPIRSEDLPALIESHTADNYPLDFFGFTPANGMERRYASTGLLTEDQGTLAVEDESGHLIGQVGWIAVQHGPSPACRALNIGIVLLPEVRGRGYGTAAQKALAEYLFGYTLIERLEAGTDVDNVAEQRSLAGAGFHREGVLRHAQYRAGQWRDIVLFSRLRGDSYG